jgi:hypothetical protein
MATQTLAGAATQSNASLILALHQRYEAAWEEYNRLDAAHTALPDKKDPERPLAWRYKEGMATNSRESDLIRVALIWQVPVTFEEATILSYHLWSLYDIDTTLSEDEKKALEIGFTNLFDFLVDSLAGKDGLDIDKMGRQFSSGAKLAYDRRRVRTGHVEEA